MKKAILLSSLLCLSITSNGQFHQYVSLDTAHLTVTCRSISQERFNSGEINSPLELISGKVAGLSIVRPGSNPDYGFDVRVRGLTTVTGNISPLIVVDDLVGANIDNINPADIETVSVINSGAGFIYGLRGTPGAIVIKTKKGKTGKPLIEYNGRTSIEMLSRPPDIMDASQWRSFSSLMHYGTDYKSNTDWIGELTQPAFSQVHNLAFSGGAKNTTFRFSGGYNNTKGIMSGTGYTLVNGRANIVQKIFRDRLRLDLNGGISEKNSDFGFSEAFKYATIFNPTAPVRSNDPAFSFFRGYFQRIAFDTYNPIAINDLNKNKGMNRAIDYSARGTWKVISGLKLSALYTFLSNRNLGNQAFDSNDLWGQWHQQSRQYNYFSDDRIETSVDYEKSLRTTQLHAFAGYSRTRMHNDMISSRSAGYMHDDITFKDTEAGFILKDGTSNPQKYTTRITDISFYGGLIADFDRSFVINAGARYEGSSQLGINNKWMLSPSAGLKADIGRLFRIGRPKSFVFHANYTVSGNYLPFFGIIGNRSSSFYFNGNYEIQKSMSVTNPDLKWEKRHDFETGLDYSRSNFYAAFNYYRILSTDLYYRTFTGIINNQPSFPGYLNVGEVRSSGLELTLNFPEIIKKSAFSYYINLSSSYILNNDFISAKTTINGVSFGFDHNVYGDMGMPGQNMTPTAIVEQGSPAGQLLAMHYVGVDSNGNILYQDINKDSGLDQNDRVVSGNGLPRIQVGFDNHLKYRKWDANISFLAVAGHDLINTYRSFYEVPFLVYDYNLPETTVNVRNEQTGIYARNSAGMLSDYHIEKGSYVSLHSISVGYTLKSQQNSAFKNLRVYLSANNLFFITKYKGSDPQPRYSDETISDNNNLVTGVDRLTAWPVTRSFSLGVNLAF